MMTIYFSRRTSKEGWTSFETSATLEITKSRVFDRCVPCLNGLLEQLRDGCNHIRLEEAWDCWKVVAVVDSYDEGLELLCHYSEAYPDTYVYGKVGTGRGRTSYAVMFHVESLERRDELYRQLTEVVRRHSPETATFYSRGCSDPYERLLGSWDQWERRSSLQYPENTKTIISELEESLSRSS